MQNRTAVLAIASCVWLFGQCALADDNIARATKYFNNRNFDAAGKTCLAELRVHPQSAEAHYLLGQIYSQQRKFEAALLEFNSALRFDPNGEIGTMSRQCIERYSRPSAPATNTVAPPQSSQQEQSTSDTAKETSQRHTELEAQRQAEIERINNDTEIQVQKLKDQLQEDMAANGVPFMGKVKYDPAPMNNVLKQQCEEKIKVLKAEGEHKLKDLNTLFEQREAAVDDSQASITRNLGK